jgi:asparagine synthase (glutamine-hydrolysing)
VTKSDLYTNELKTLIHQGEVSKVMASWLGEGKCDLSNAAMRADFAGRLPDGYLAKVDFASMASAVEVRTPFLDYRLVELSQQIPSKLKIKDGGKYIWKEIVKDKIPVEIINRRKMGFSLPLDSMLKKDMLPILESTIFSAHSLVSKYFEQSVVNRLWKDHCSGKADYSNHIWSILMLELWLKNLEK